MYRTISSKSSLVAALFAAGCADDPAPEDAASAWQTLISGTWSIDPGTEDYRCVRKTVDEDIALGALEAINPPGTHHTVLSYGPPTGPDGIAPCLPFESNAHVIFGSGVGTAQFEMPERVAIVISAGEQILLNLHVFNTGGAALEGESGTSARTVDRADVDFDADGALMGTLDITLPPRQTSTVVGGCVLDDEATIYGLFPHMHTLGTHMKITASTAAAGDVVLWDAPYDFEDQHMHAVPFLETVPGDIVRVECTYDNPNDHEVTYGDHTSDEMCFAGISRFPATGESICVNLAL